MCFGVFRRPMHTCVVEQGGGGGGETASLLIISLMEERGVPSASMSCA